MSLLSSDYLPYILIFITFWLVVITALWIRLFFLFRSFTKDTKKKDLVSSLNKLLKKTNRNQTDLQDQNKQLKALIEKNRLNFQKLGFLRFNPFTSTGGNQSFVLCLLDENDDGFVISSLHSRESTRIYAKSIQSGKSPDQVLSDEEKKVIKQAQKQWKNVSI